MNRPPEAKPKVGGKKPFPRSMVINFVAIAALFAVIFALQHVSRSWVTAEPEMTKSIQTTTVTLDENGAVEKMEVASDVEVEETAPETPPAKQETVPATVTLEEKTAEVEKPAPKVEKKVARKKPVRAYRLKRKSASKRDPYWRDRQVSVEELDGGNARQNYNAMNRDLAGGSPGNTRYQPTYAEPVRATTYDEPAYETSPYRQTTYVDDLDGESARMNYRAENKRLSGPDADLD